jgi:hypothetical protein
VLSLDADYELSNELVRELEELAPLHDTVGYRVRFVYRIFGKPLRASLYPPRVVLYQKAHAFYRNEGHSHRVMVNGNVCELRGVIYHDDRKPLSRWLSSQKRYATEEARYLIQSHHGPLTRIDRIRLMGWPAPLAAFCYTLFVKRCILDGWAGWYYVLQRVIVEMLVALEIVDRRLRLKQD